MSRRIIRVAHRVLQIDQRIRVRRREVGTDVSGPACVYAQIRVTRGSLAYLTGDNRVIVADRCELFLPPFAIVQAALEQCDVTTFAIAFRAPGGVLNEPVVLRAGEGPVLRSREEVLERLQTAKNVTYVGRAPDPAPVAARAKAILDGEYATSLEIAGIAARLETSPAVLSRVFKASYGVPPVRYRHQVRIMDALMQLAEGAAPIDVFQDVGFDDLSRFYKIFRKIACDAPGSFRPIQSRSAKT